MLGLMVVVVLALAAGCGGGDDANEAATTGAPAAATTEAPPADTGSGETPAGETHTQEDTDGGSLSTVSPAVDLRVALDRLLAEHAALAMFATQKGLAGEKDFEAIAAALDANTVELSEAIGSVYGEDAAKEFLDGDLKWRAHIGFFVDYTVALAEKDEEAQKEAVDNLMGYTAAFSTFLAEATGLPQEALREGLVAHVEQLKGQIDAYAAGDYEKAYELYREAYHHMWLTGDTLAEAIVVQNPEAFTG